MNIKALYVGKKPPTPQPPAPTSITLHLSVWFQGDLYTVPTATLELDQYPLQTFTGTVTSENRYAFTVPAATALGWGAWLRLSATDATKAYDERCIVALDIQDVALEPAAPPRRSQDSLRRVMANFCNLRDSQDRVIFTADLMGLDDATRADWYAALVSAGSTHIVYSPTGGNYPGTPWQPFDYYGDPQRVAAIAREILQLQAVDGYAVTPVLFLDDGAPGFPDRMRTFWQPIRDAIGDDQVDCIVCPGWELVAASSVTSKQYSDALQLLHAQGWTHLWAHLSPGRAACSSNPLEPDDPWQGGESDCWKSYGGQYVEGLLFQDYATRPPDELDPPTAEWIDRWNDVVPRIGTGMNGWRVMGLCFFESQAYYYYRGQSTSDWCRQLASRAKQVSDSYGVTCGWGNGLPY